MGLGIPQQVGDEEDYSLYSLKNISFEDNCIHILIILSHLVKEMMFGFGDSIEPYPETIKLMDELVKDFMVKLVVVRVSVYSRPCVEWTLLREQTSRLMSILSSMQ